MLVFVLNKHNKPLMPCKPQKARKLLKEGKAKVVKRTPFTIKMIHGSSGFKQEIVAGMDTGSKTIGTAVITNGEVVYQAETKLRGQKIKKKMEQRAMYRRTRRGKLRYRKPRFLNRKNSTKLNRLPPSVKHKVEAHLREKREIEKILPVSRWFIETANFDIHKITNPEVIKDKSGKAYQRGPKYGLGFQNTKQFILNRDKYTCQKCSKNKDGLKLEVHHITFRSRGGTDTPNNLVTLCSSCHKKIHTHKNAEKESLKLQTKVKKNTKHATEISVVASQLRKSDWEFEETFGYITKFNRMAQGLEKTHFIDAVMIASQGEIVVQNSLVLKKVLVSKGDYQQTKGIRSEKKIPTGKTFGLRKFDLIQTSKGIGFIKGKRSSEYFALMDIDGKKIHDSVSIKKECRRLSARKLILTSLEVA